MGYKETNTGDVKHNFVSQIRDLGKLGRGLQGDRKDEGPKERCGFRFGRRAARALSAIISYLEKNSVRFPGQASVI